MSNQKAGETANPIVAKRRVFTGKVVRVDEVELDFGPQKQPTYELVTFNSLTGVSALPLIDTDVLLIRHYQLGIQAVGWSLPTGGLAEGENPEERMQWELMEEIGMKAQRLTLMARLHALPGYIGSEAGYFYLAQDLVPASKAGDEEYEIELVRMPLIDALTKVEQGEIQDARTVLGLLYYRTFFQNRR